IPAWRGRRSADLWSAGRPGFRAISDRYRLRTPPCRASDRCASVPRRAAGRDIARDRHFDEGGENFRALRGAARLEQGLFLARAEGACHGEGVDEVLDRRRFQHVGLGGDAMALEERPQRRDHALAIDILLVFLEIAAPGLPVGDDLTEQLFARRLARDIETRHTLQ